MFQDGEYEAAALEVGLGCEVEWFPGGWMSRQRFAGRLGGKAEFPCGLTGGGGRFTVGLEALGVLLSDDCYEKCECGGKLA